MNDSIEITLPVSGARVEIRNYTTQADDERAEQCLYAGVVAEQDEQGKQRLSFPAANIMASQKSYVPRLVRSIDGDSSSIELRLKDLRTEDYQVIEEAIEKIVDEHSPKAIEAKNASTKSTN